MPKGRPQAYSAKLKQKVDMFNIVINRRPRGAGFAYMAAGTTEDGELKLSAIMGEETALAALAEGFADRGEGW